ncbi:expressed protein [Phakopsora pachyrhizi]|uniref:Expressed protein n=1 Tax=Phakopsora pachyrhizi TaxID=170000 RepID=A0AAV0ALP8_PHAPC|nr:expressed protein [Phakopsora pachyrhizi]
MATASSSAISSFISEASSDLDPLFHSPQIRDSRQQSSQASSSRPSPNLNSEFSSNLSPISSFPLPPRRLRPGERIEVSDLFATNLLAASSFAAEKKSPSSAYPQLAPHNPVSLYGVAIGGGNITNSLKKFNGRAEIQQSTGYSALQLRKLSLKNRNNQNQSNGSKENLNDGTSLRARTPARILAPSAASGNSNSPSSSALLPESPPPNSRVSVIEKASMPPPRPQRTDSLVSFTGIDEEKFTATNALSVRPSLSIQTDQLQPAQLLLRNAVQSRLNPSNHLEPPSNQAINESLIIPANFIGGEATLRPYVGLNHLTDPKEVERIIQSSPSHTESGLIINSSKVKSNPITVPFQPNSNQKLESRNVEQSSNNKTSLIKFATSPYRAIKSQTRVLLLLKDRKHQDPQHQRAYTHLGLGY